MKNYICFCNDIDDGVNSNPKVHRGKYVKNKNYDERSVKRP